MKNHLIALFTLTIFGLSANAQTKNPATAGKQQHHQKMDGKNMHRGKGRQAVMMKELNFSEAQKEQLKNIRSEYRDKINQLEQDKTITLQDYRSKKAELQKEQKEKFESVLIAEQKEKLAQARRENGQKREMMEQKKIERMKSQLDLTDAQVSQLQSQQNAFKTEAKAIKDNTSLSPEQKKEQLMDLRKSSQESMKNILTAGQLQKREEMRKNRFNDMKNRRTEKSS